jgi:hypothetical protein
LPETIILVSYDVDLCKSTNLCLSWSNISYDWVLIESVFLRTFGVWVVDVLLESNTEW